MTNINEYQELVFYKSFSNSHIAHTVALDFDKLSWEKNFELLDNHITPRQRAGDKMPVPRKFSMVPFYYINFLLEKSSDKIYDLGCGWNIFKKYIPNIIGVAAEDPLSQYFYGDIHDLVDESYVRYHQNYFESVFSINALHFCPIDNLRDVVLDFASMIKSGGRGFLAINLQRMIDRAVDRRKFLDFNFNYDLYVRTELNNVPFNYLVFDVDLTVLDDSMDGNIRLVIEK